MLDSQLMQQIEQSGQGHLLQFWNGLSEEEQRQLSSQISSLDWDLIQSYQRDLENSGQSPSDDVRHATPPAHVVRIPDSDAGHSDRKQARSLGEAALRSGQVGVVLLAGGQGTRLGFQQSKGLFPIGPVTGMTLLEILAQQVRAMSEKYGRSIPYFAMTNDGSHGEIEAFYQKHDYFGLNPRDVFLFPQGFAPSIDLKTGQVLLAEKSSLCLNPDGHGGIFQAMWKAGLFDEMKNRGIDYLFSHQVDNPLVKVCDPDFIGLHLQHHSEVSTKVVAKTAPEERVGIAVDIGGRTRIIEYIDLPDDMARMTDPGGGLRFWAGNTAIHLFNRSFLERVATDHSELPWHRAIKKIPYIDQHGDRIAPETENAVKFERFIFDTLPLAEVALIVETSRDEEFAPLKNKDGEFSPEYVKSRMVRQALSWLNAAGITVPEGLLVEISPRFAMSAEEVAARVSELQNIPFDRPQFLGETRSLDSKPSN